MCVLAQIRSDAADQQRYTHGVKRFHCFQSIKCTVLYNLQSRELLDRVASRVDTHHHELLAVDLKSPLARFLRFLSSVPFYPSHSLLAILTATSGLASSFFLATSALS